MAVVGGGVRDCSRPRVDGHRRLARLVDDVMLAAGMVVLALATFALMLGFVALCDRV
jgi:hypothetical protein